MIRRDTFVTENILSTYVLTDMKILLLDADPVSNLIFRRQLRKYYPDINLDVYVDSDEFLSQIKTISDKVDLLLIDIHLPKHSVSEILENVKVHGLRAEVVLISSYVDAYILDSMLAFKDVNLLVEKPLTSTKIKTLLRTSLN